MAYIISTTGVAILSTDDNLTPETCLTFQRVGDNFYIDVWPDVTAAKDGRSPEASYLLQTEDVKKALDEMGVI